MMKGFVILFCSLQVVCRAAEDLKAIRHYVFFNRDRERIKDSFFLETKGFKGAQIKYTWRELEPEKDRYDFKKVQEDYAFLSGKEKRLFVQLQDSSFDEKILNVPEYLRRESEFNGGADRQYQLSGEKDEKPVPAGWVARRWDGAVRTRFQKLLKELGEQFDGKIEGINLAETSVDFGETGKLYPRGFTPEIYRDAIVANMAAAKAAFSRSVVMQYANFMPGEWLPESDHGLLKSVFARAKEFGVAVGGPDLLPYKPGQMKHSYPLIKEAAGVVPTGVAVQWGNYEQRDPRSGKQVTIAEIEAFAHEFLKVDYVFWSMQEPFFSEQVVPFVKKRVQD